MNMYSERDEFDLKKVVRAGILIVLLLVGLTASGKLFENVDADEILVVQDPFDGDLHWYISPGVKPQWFGKVTTYPKRAIYEFDALPVQFNDGGKGSIKGSIQYDMPLDVENLTELHTRFGTQQAIQKQVMEVVTNKVIYMTGPVMSSRESYAEKRNDLIRFVQDQIDNGVYQTRRVTEEQVDQFTGQTKTVTVAQIVIGKDGRPARQEQSVVGEFAIRAFNFAIAQIDYDEVVDRQIADQQKITMEVQTSIADAVKAQQAAITAEQQGLAAAARARWEQEVIKAKEVTAAEQRLAVADLDRQAAEQTRQKEILLGQGEAERKRLVLAADGALAQKLATMEAIQTVWADAYAKRQVPAMVMGSSTQGGTDTQTTDFAQMMTLMTASQLGLDLTIPRGNTVRDGG